MPIQSLQRRIKVFLFIVSLFLIVKFTVPKPANTDVIPQKVLDKIFQPFFTTKPTGQGTGLGLSLSYDIVKAHGGELKVETKEGEFAQFIIVLPI
jgi:nitrogen-specific signal transduction histidine kinase